MDRFVDGDIPLQTFCDLMDAKQARGKKKPPPVNLSSANLKPVRNFFKQSKSRQMLNQTAVEPKVTSDEPFMTLTDLLADLNIDDEPQLPKAPEMERADHPKPQ